MVSKTIALLENIFTPSTFSIRKSYLRGFLLFSFRNSASTSKETKDLIGAVGCNGVFKYSIPKGNAHVFLPGMR